MSLVKIWGQDRTQLDRSAVVHCATMSGKVSCKVRNSTGNACCVSMLTLDSGETPKEHMVKPDEELSCSLEASEVSQLRAWYQSEPAPSTHVFPAGTNSAVVELTASLTSTASVGTAGTDGKQKLTFVNQCSVDVSFRLFFKDDYKCRLVFAGETETYELDEAHATSFGAHFQYPPKNGVSDFRYIPLHEASIDGTEVIITFKPTIALKMSPVSGVLESAEGSIVRVRNSTGNACCVSMLSEETRKEHVVKPDAELSCNLGASKVSQLTAWYWHLQPAPSTHLFPAGTNSAVVELTASLTSTASVGTAGTDGKQKLTFVNQCSVDVSFRLFFKDDYKCRLVFAGETETYELDEAHATSFGAHFQYPPKNGVSDFRYIPLHEASIDGTEVIITFKPTIALKTLEAKPPDPREAVQDLFRKYDPGY